MADVNATQGEVAGKSWKKTASKNGKKNGWRIITAPSRPAVASQYDGATTGILLNGLTRVPTPTPPNYPTYNLSVGPNH